jgi:predicted ATP-dependent protease
MLAGVPLRQDIAVTGSVNQHGGIQAVGGINEKIKGFFEACRVKGLTGQQAVCIPRSNRGHLVPRHDVIDTMREGRLSRLGHRHGGRGERAADQPARR